MSYSRLSAVLSAGLLACLILVAVSPQAAAKNLQKPVFPIGATYIITNTDATTGAFVSRGAITFHADGTLSVIDSAQGGPTFFFSSQLGTWGFNSKGVLAGRTIDFDFQPDNDVARLDYTFTFGAKNTISGTISLYTFPLTGNPLGSGTLAGTFNFTGYLVPLS